MSKPTHIIEDSANNLWAVWPTGDENLAHVWYGYRVKKAKGGFAPLAKARQLLVRREATRVIATF